MRPHLSATTAAVVLTILAVTVPCGAWYIAGSRSARTEAEQLVGLARLKANQTASSLAGRISGRLGVLLDTESRRPVYQYQHTYTDPNTDCDCETIIPSPLALGPEDALIRTHFQIVPSGQLSLPTLGSGSADEEKRDREWLRQQRNLRRRLQESVDRIRQAVADRERERLDNPACERKMVRQVIPAWNGEAVVVIEVEVPGFEWHVVDLDGDSSLVALREMGTPIGTVIQGFVVSAEAVTRSLEGAYLPALFEPGQVAGGGGHDRDVSARIPLEWVNWVVRVDAGDLIDEAEEGGGAIGRRFLTTFALSSAAAVLAGIFVIGLVWQTDRLSRERSRFAAAAAHELRTPLAGLQLYSDMVAQGLGDPKRTKEYAARIAGESQRLAGVVSNVLGFSQLERRSMVVRPERGDLASAVKGCIGRLRPAFESRGLAVRFRGEDRCPPALFDKEALFHIVQNLLDNAEKFTRSTGKRTVDVAIRALSDSVALTVSDRGEGIPDREKKRLFRSFARSNRSDSSPGLGLGLLIVRQFAEAQGGRVSVSDTPGGGATFTVTFPV